MDLASADCDSLCEIFDVASEKLRQRSALLQLQMVLALTLTLVLALTLALDHVPERLMNYLEPERLMSYPEYYYYDIWKDIGNL